MLHQGGVEIGWADLDVRHTCATAGRWPGWIKAVVVQQAPAVTVLGG